jgi:hypothetical protein
MIDPKDVPDVVFIAVTERVETFAVWEVFIGRKGGCCGVRYSASSNYGDY